MLDKLGINPLNLIGQIVNFLIIFFVLKKFLFKPILKILEERAKKINEGLKAAEENIKKQEEIEALKKEEMKKARQEVENILKKAQDQANENAKEIIKKAQEEAKKQAEKEFLLMKRNLEKEEKALKGKMAEIALMITKKILSETLNDSLQKQIIQSQLKKLKNFKV